MMNEGLKEFIKGMGALTEMWTVTYRGFLTQGYTASEALVHTREFTAALITALMGQGQNKNDKGE